MGIARSTFYDQPTAARDDTAIVGVISGCEFRRNPGRGFRFNSGHRSDLIPATIPN